MKDERAVEALCSALLTDGQAEVRQTAAEALGEIRSSEAISSLKQALNDPEPRVRAKAGWAIHQDHASANEVCSVVRCKEVDVADVCGPETKPPRPQERQDQEQILRVFSAFNLYLDWFWL